MRTMVRVLSVAVAATALFLAACAAPAPGAGDEAAVVEEAPEEVAAPEEGAAAAEPVEEIAWFEGTVDEAFAYAAAERKPLFLYWGAEWCPPCHYLKVTTFHKPEFVARSREFVPVYLDGDHERAQIYGEQFEVAGYPTVIVFNPDGQEVTRLGTGVPIGEYARVLDVSKTLMVPMKEVLARVAEQGAAGAPAEDLELLAFYAWDQDEKVDLPDEEAFDTFRALYEQTPADMPVVKARFLAHYLNAAIDRAAERADAAAEAEEAGEAAGEPEPVFDADELAALRAAVTEMLTTPELRAADLSFVQYWSRETVELLHPEPGAERAAFAGVWDEAAQALEADETLSVDDRLTVMYPRLELARMLGDDAAAAAGTEPVEPAEAVTDTAAVDVTAAEGVTENVAVDVTAAEGVTETVAEGEAVEEPAEPELPAELVAHVRERVAWAGERVTDEGELQAVMSSMVWMLEEIGDDAAAAELLEARMGDTLAPYYFMSWLGGKKADAGDDEGALVWYRRAYDEATGRYTRFRWGSTYLGKLLELAPDDVARIEADSAEILAELLAHDDAFMLGNWSRLETFGGNLESWNEDGAHDASVAKVRDQVRAACDAFRAPDDRVAGDGDAAAGASEAVTVTDGVTGAVAAGEGDAAAAPADDEGVDPNAQYERCTSFLAEEEGTAEE